MIQVNLLPGVKQEFMHAQRLKRLVLLGSIVISGGAVLLTGSLFAYVNYGQKRHITNLTADVDTHKKELQALPNIDRILTVQNQLKALPALHEDKPVVTRLFTFMSTATPTNIGISTFKVSTTDHKITVDGSAPSLEAINTFVDTLKFMQYKQQDSNEQPRAFSKVVLVSSSKTDKGTTFSISFEFDPALIDFKTYNPVNDGVIPIVTNTVTTRLPSESVFQTPAGSK